MMHVEGSKVKIRGIGVTILTEFAMLCHDLMEQGIDKDDLLFAVAMASTPDDKLLQNVPNREKLVSMAEGDPILMRSLTELGIVKE